MHEVERPGGAFGDPNVVDLCGYCLLSADRHKYDNVF